MKILAIETSCDDTGIAILQAKASPAGFALWPRGFFRSKFKVLANKVSSQPIHQNYGGVFPMMAKREHQKNLVPTLILALTEANMLKLGKNMLKSDQIAQIKHILDREDNLFESVKIFLETHEKPKVDAIAVTFGPGLEPCLWVGINFAKVISLVWDLPIIPVNHIEAHILVNYLQPSTTLRASHKIAFPAISLVVSGGHTQLILVKGLPAGRGNYEIIGETRDDAAGECFDKCAKLLGLGYPGGPIISQLASKSPTTSIVLPRPMANSKDYDFSFSGLKTAVLYKIRDLDPKIVESEQFRGEMSVAVQDAICDVLIKKTLLAAKEYGAKTIILGGGVSANQELRKRFTEESPIKVIFPDHKLSTDNGLMIAVAGYFNRKEKAANKDLTANANLRVESRS